MIRMITVMIRPEMKKFYSKDWHYIANKLKRSLPYCESCFDIPVNRNCLTVHHVDFNPANNDVSNLLVLCARCHLRKHARINRYGRENKNQLVLFA